VGHELGNLHGVFEALFVLAFLNPGTDLKLTRRPVEGAVDLNGAEILGIIIKPGCFLISQLYRVEATYPIIVRPATTAHQDRHSACDIEGRRDIDFLGISLEKITQKAKPFFVRQLVDKVGVEMSKDCNLIAGTEVSSRKAAINVIHEIEEEHFEEPEMASKECDIYGELVDPACLLFIGRNSGGQDLFACGNCCNSGSFED